MDRKKNFKRREAARRRNAESTHADGGASTVQQRNATIPGYNPVLSQPSSAIPATPAVDDQPTATLALPTRSKAVLDNPVTLPALPDLSLLFPKQTLSGSAQDTPGTPGSGGSSSRTVVAQPAPHDDADHAPFAAAAAGGQEGPPTGQQATPTRLRSGTAKSSPARLDSHLSPQETAAAARASSDGSGFAPMPEEPQEDDDAW